MDESMLSHTNAHSGSGASAPEQAVVRHVRIAFERHHEAAADVREGTPPRACAPMPSPSRRARRLPSASRRGTSPALPTAGAQAPPPEADEVIAGNGSGHAVGQRFVPESSYHVVEPGRIWWGRSCTRCPRLHCMRARPRGCSARKTRFAGNREGGVEDLLFADDGFVAHAHLPRAEARDPVVSLIVEEDSCVAREEMVVDFRPSLPPSAGLSNMNVVH